MRRRKPNVHLVRVLDDAELVAPLDDDAVLAREVDLAPLASATGARVGEGERAHDDEDQLVQEPGAGRDVRELQGGISTSTSKARASTQAYPGLEAAQRARAVAVGRRPVHLQNADGRQTPALRK